MRHQLLAVATLAVFVAACEEPKVEPQLVITPSPRTLDGEGQVATVKVQAIDDENNPGTGTVRVSSSAGSLVDGVEVSLTNGEGTTEFGCVRAEDPACTGNVRLTAEWAFGGKTISIGTNVQVRPAVMPDAGLSLTSSRTSVGVGLGQRATLTATYALNGAPTSGQLVNLSTTLGTILSADGGAWVATSTDSAGQVQALFTESGAAGTATITASTNDGKSASVDVAVYLPDAGISIASDATLLTVGFDQSARITVSHNLGGASIAGHPITVESTLGELRELDGGAFVSPALTNSSGQVVALLKETGVPGPSQVTATDVLFGKSATTSVTFARPDAGVTVMASRSPIYLGINDAPPITALLLTNGMPAGNQPLAVTTSLGELSLPDGGAFANPGTTGPTGALELTLRPTGTAGTATVTATDPSSGRNGSTAVAIREITTVTYVSMTCGGAACSIMGIAGSGFNTTASLRFRVTDSATQPVAGVPVAFSTETAATTIVVQPSGVTDSSGFVDVSVVAGVNTGTFVVTAQVLPGISSPSPTIGVRGAKPTSQGISMNCTPVNLAAYRAASFPLNLPSTCVVTLTDRRNNPVGTGKIVEFASEAGNIPATATALAYSVMMPTNPNEGKATNTFSTPGFPAKEVEPLGAATQYPVNRAAEPSRAVDSLVLNPRDGLVTIVAFTDGEEHFTDVNNNGTWDPGEPFVDIGEPFVDTNDNDIFDGEDIPISAGDVNGNGVWDGPNGHWDANTKVWTKAWVLYTDSALVASTSQSSFNVPKGGEVSWEVFARDPRLNRMEGGTTLPASRTGNKGSFNFASIGTLLDGYGFDVTYPLLNAAGTGPCGGAPICAYHTRFTTWWNGYIGRLTVTGAPTSDMTAPQSATFTVTPTTRSVGLQIPVAGTIQ